MYIGCHFQAMVFPPSSTQQLFDGGDAAEVVIQGFPQSPAVALP